MRYAVVRDGIVENIIECDGMTVQPLEKVMRCTLVPCEQYPVGIGDTYQDGVFLREGEEVERIPTERERIAMLEQENQRLSERLEAAEQATLGLMRMAAEV